MYCHLITHLWTGTLTVLRIVSLIPWKDPGTTRYRTLETLINVTVFKPTHIYLPRQLLLHHYGDLQATEPFEFLHAHRKWLSTHSFLLYPFLNLRM